MVAGLANDMSAFTSVFVTGASVGCVYALLAAAYALVFKASHTLNLALGGLLLIGGYTAFQVGKPGAGAPFWLATLIAVAVVSLVGWLIQLEWPGRSSRPARTP